MALEQQISARLKEVRSVLNLSQEAMALKIGLSKSAVKRLETGGNVPSGESLLKYAAVGINPGWLLYGLGPMRMDGPSEAVPPDEDAPTPPPAITAPELLALVTDAIQRSYKDAGASLSALDLGRLSAEKYNEIIQEIPEPEGWPVAVRMMAVQLRKDIASTAANPSARKREAS